jgi:hypothetical protein
MRPGLLSDEQMEGIVSCDEDDIGEVGHTLRIEKGQLRDIRDGKDGKSLTRLEGVGSSGRIRTENPPSTPADPEQLKLDLKGT